MSAAIRDGLTLDASDPSFYAEANRPAYLEIHERDPVYWVEAARTQSFWNVCEHELIRQVGKNGVLFTTQFGVHLANEAFALESAEEAEAPTVPDDPRLVAALYPANIMDAESHRRVRAPINPHFRHDEVGKLEDGVREAIRGALDELEPEETVDFMETYAVRVPLLVTTRLLGVPEKRERDFLKWADTVLESFEPGAVPDWSTLAEMVEYFTAEVADRRANPRDDLITKLIATDLSDEEVVMWCWLLLVAGLETTGNLIGAGLRLLLHDPEAHARVVADHSLLRQSVAEMLRVVTPGRYIRRTATADTEIGGHHVSAGDAVVMNFTVANFDPAMFAEPLRFDIDRQPNDALAFSYGQHRCVGMSVARLESRIAFEELFDRYPNTEIRGEAVFRPSLATAVVESLPVAFRA